MCKCTYKSKMMKEMMKEMLIRNEKMQNFAKRIVRTTHVLADPDRYVRCEKRIPNAQVFLKDELLQNCAVISCRESLLEKIPCGGIGAEVGVAEGYFSDLILKICKPKKLYMIEFNEEYCENLKKRFKEQIESGLVEILQGDSAQMLSNMKDHELDFVYLDATHDYEHPKKELEICDRKVKETGMIMGHDYTRFSMWENEQYGVIEAVNEFMITHNYEMKYITLDMLSSNSSYAIRKK